MYTITIKIKEYADKNFKNILAALRLGYVCKNGKIDYDTETMIFTNLTRKKAIKIVSKIKSIKNFENIATYTIIKED